MKTEPAAREKNLSPTTRDRCRRRTCRNLRYWLAYGALAIVTAATVTHLLPMWFRDDDGAFLSYVASHPLKDIFNPATGTVQGLFRPISIAVFWLAYHGFGLTCWPYQFMQILLTFGIWAAFFVMFRQFWPNARWALVATVLHPVMFCWLYYFTFQFSKMVYQLELVLGCSAVTVAAVGWRRRNVLLIIASLLLTELAYGAKEPACVYLPILHIWAAILLGRRAGVAKKWILLWVVVLGALTAWHVTLVRGHIKLLAVSGAFAIDTDFVVQRLQFYAGLLNCGAGGLLLAAIAGAACGAQTARIPLPGRIRWFLVPLAAVAGAAASRFIHPVIPVIVACVASRYAIGFALAAAVMVAVTAQLEPMWTLYIMQATWLMTAALVAAIFHSPVPQAFRRANTLCRSRAKLDLRLAGAALVAVFLVVLSAGIRGKFQALQITSQRRCISRDLTKYLAKHLPDRSGVAIAVWEDIQTTHRQQHAMPQLDRAAVLIQWYPNLYQQLLGVYGRPDITVVKYSDVTTPGFYVLATSRREVQATRELLERVATPAPAEPVLLKSVRYGQQLGELWHLRRTTGTETKDPLGRRPVGSKTLWGEDPLWRRPVGSQTRWVEEPLRRRSAG